MKLREAEKLHSQLISHYHMHLSFKHWCHIVLYTLITKTHYHHFRQMSLRELSVQYAGLVHLLKVFGSSGLILG